MALAMIHVKSCPVKEYLRKIRRDSANIHLGDSNAHMVVDLDGRYIAISRVRAAPNPWKRNTSRMIGLLKMFAHGALGDIGEEKCGGGDRALGSEYVLGIGEAYLGVSRLKCGQGQQLVRIGWRGWRGWRGWATASRLQKRRVRFGPRLPNADVTSMTIKSLQFFPDYCLYDWLWGCDYVRLSRSQLCLPQERRLQL